MFKKSLMLLVVAFASGCATGPATYDDLASEALNVMRAAGMQDGMEDVTGNYSLEQDAKRLSTAFKVGVVGYYGMADMLTEGVLLAVFAPKSPGVRNWLIAWQPIADMSPDEARQRLKEITDEAIAKTAKEWDFEGTRFKKIDEHGRIHFEGGRCDEQGYECSFRPWPLKVFAPKTKVAPAPEWLGGGDRYAYVEGTAARALINQGLSRKDGDHAIAINEVEFFRRVSEHMPEWAYFYFAPNKVSWGTEIGFIQVPVMLNQGRVLLFVTPSNDTE